MASFVFETIVINVVWFVSKADQAVEFPVVHFFCNDIIRMSMEQIQDGLNVNDSSDVKENMDIQRIVEVIDQVMEVLP